MADQQKEPGILRELFNTFFAKHWPVWVGGVTLQ